MAEVRGPVGRPKAGDARLLACALLGLLREKYPDLLSARYKVEWAESDTDYELFERVARKRGWIRAGGVVDEERACSVLLDEFRAGTIGPMTLDSV